MNHGVIRRIARLWDRSRGEDGVALMMTVLLMLLLSGLSILVLGLVVTQVNPTQYARKNTRSIYAAEAGIEAALSQLRTASAAPDFTGRVYGDVAALPNQVQGVVADGSGNLGYEATITYFRENPAGQTDAWRLANKMAYPLVQQPAFAYVESQGLVEEVPRVADDSAERTLISVYRFNITNTNIVGGRIYAYGDTHCLRADGITAGSTISYIAKDQCGPEHDETELWVYDTSYQIKLASTMLPPGPELCITGPSSGGNPEKATLQVCKTDATRWNQLWSWEAGAHWKGENSTITDYSSYCLNSGQNSDVIPDGQKLHVGTSCADRQARGSFNPDSAVGPGAAGADTHQITNYLEFGRCLDVTHESVTENHMIVYPCKQDPSPDGDKLAWNHKWYYTEPTADSGVGSPQQIRINTNKDGHSGTNYCLRSPGVAGGFVTLTTPCSTTAQDQKWTRYQNTGNYGTSYVFVDGYGMCLALGPRNLSTPPEPWSSVVVTGCTGEIDQKWNADPRTVQALVGDYLESYG